MQIYSVARNVLGALGPRVKVPVLDAELKIPAECGGGSGIYKSWVHVDVRGKRARWRG